jgi:hypothetical protein
LYAAVVRHAADRLLKLLELPFLHRQPVEEDDIEDDPADREKAGDRSQNSGTDRHRCRHGEDEDCDQIGNDERDDGCDMCLHHIGCDKAEKNENGNCGEYGGQNSTARGVINLIPH